ncbi:MAG TPA: HAMP domain-containing histidine kinase [Armatimonadetes bacterium]|nr:HAMP domain-containing histidine kinase [Armatimonadota bacterium]
MLGAVAVLRDITELKQLDQLRTDFIMSISHDIRSPLTAIKGFAASLLRGSFGELDKQQSHAVEVILQQSERLMEMVEQLTCATHAFPSRVALQLERIDIREVVDECATAYKGISTSRGIALHTDMPSEPVLADVDRNALSRIIANLLDNAIKYTPSQGSVTLRVRSNPNFAIVEVSDTGIGIPPEHLGKIFAPFYRGAHHPEDSEVRGLGLGLSITKNLVEAHGGTIDVESKLGHGTTFRIMLPHHGRERLESVDEGGGSSVNTN